MPSIVELKQSKGALLDVADGMLAKIEKENRRFKPDEQSQYGQLTVAIKQLDHDILTLEAKEERSRKAAEAVLKGNAGGNYDVDPEKSFRNGGEFMFAIAREAKDHVTDPRLDVLREKREQTMGTGSTGGYALPEQFDANLRKDQAQQGVSGFRLRSTSDSASP